MRLASVVATAVASTIAAAASASTMSISFGSGQGLSNLGSFTGSMQWSYAGGGATSGFLTVSLTNTSSLSGYLTAFALNGPASGVTYSLQAPTGDASQFGMIGGGANPSGTINAAPWDNYIVGASTSNSWTGGGNPNKGLAVGETGSFTFKVSAVSSLLAGLDVLSFFTNDDEGNPELAVRFRGFSNGGSDKVGAELTVVPVPMPVAIAALGLIGAGLVRRRMTAR